MGKFIDLTGQKFGRLLVLKKKKKRQSLHIVWLCKCKCGTKVSVLGYSLKNGKTKSCGCYNLEMVRTHMMSGTYLYKIWIDIKDRCNNKNNTSYKNYGSRGIKICKEWNKDFMKFREWCLNNGFDKSLELDRRNNDKGYSPDNCRWITKKQNNRNKRTNVFIIYKGKRRTLIEVSELTGINYRTLVGRYGKGFRGKNLIFISQIMKLKKRVKY